jgi:DNA-binding IclR family transcriptional regulator
MVPQDIPAEILTFLEQRIDSVPQLETLLMMSELGDRAWTVEDVASRTYISVASARSVLEALHRRGLIAPDDPVHGYRFGPHDSADVARVARVAEYYRANLVAVATLIHEKASASVQEFARAFEFKKDH